MKIPTTRRWLPPALLLAGLVLASRYQSKHLDACAVLEQAASQFGLDPSELVLEGATLERVLLGLQLEGQFRLADRGGRVRVETAQGFPFGPWVTTHYERAP